MPAEWIRIAERAGYELAEGNVIIVALDGGSEQKVKIRVDERRGVLEASSVVATRVILAAASGEMGERYAWERNRLSDLVGFTLDRHGRLIGQAWIPLEGLTSDEFALYVSELGRVCDWHEFRLSGTDTY